MVQHGRRPAVLKRHRRAFVASSDTVYGSGRMFGSFQDSTGDVPPVVRSMAQAYAQLGVAEPDLQPLEQS